MKNDRLEIRIDKSQKKQLKEVAKKKKVTTSELVNESIKRIIKEQ